MQTLHLLKENSMKSQLVLFLYKLFYFIHGSQIHKVSSIHCNVYSKFFVTAQVASTHMTAVLDIINHERPIMDNFCQTTSEVDVFVFFVFGEIPSETLSKHQTKKRSPLLAAALEQIING